MDASGPMGGDAATSDGEAAPLPLHQRILSDLRGAIVTGAWPPGHRIPSEHELAARYGCARMTVNKVLTQLARAGLVERRRKAGTFVARPQAQSAVLEIHDIRREVADLGLAYRFTLDRRRARPLRRIETGQLALKPGAPVLDLACRHFASGAPFCLERRLIGLDAVPAAATADFSALPPGAWLMAQVPWTRAEHRIRAMAADATEAAALDLPPRDACLVVERRTWSGDQPITFVSLTYPAGAHAVVARFEPAA